MLTIYSSPILPVEHELFHVFTRRFRGQDVEGWNAGIETKQRNQFEAKEGTQGFRRKLNECTKV